MRKLLASLGVLCIASVANAQTGYYTLRVDDGKGFTAWKVTGPSGGSDWFNNDFTGMGAAGRTTAAMWIDISETSGTAVATASKIGLYHDDGTATGTPNIASPYVELTGTTFPAGDTWNSDTKLSIPGVAITADDVHMALNFTAGDSTLWLVSDTCSPSAGRSFFTGTSYALGAAPFAVDWKMYVGLNCLDGELLINGATSTSAAQNQTVCVTFCGCQAGQFTFLYFCPGGVLFQNLLFIPTGFGGPTPNTWMICGKTTCSDPTGFPIELCVLYVDPCDTKPNGNAKIKLSSLATLTITADNNCGTQCFGIKDDNVFEGSLWKVSNPAGGSDWFSVNHGSVGPSVSMITGVETLSWDFCGIGPSWAEVGVYPDDGTGRPDIANPSSNILGGAIAPGNADWAFPATFYDIPDFAPVASTNYHAAHAWPVNDSCIWLGADTDGTDNTVAGCQVGFSGDSTYTSDDYNNLFAICFANWMMRITWN